MGSSDSKIGFIEHSQQKSSKKNDQKNKSGRNRRTTPITQIDADASNGTDDIVVEKKVKEKKHETKTKLTVMGAKDTNVEHNDHSQEKSSEQNDRETKHGSLKQTAPMTNSKEEGGDETDDLGGGRQIKQNQAERSQNTNKTTQTSALLDLFTSLTYATEEQDNKKAERSSSYVQVKEIEPANQQKINEKDCKIISNEKPVENDANENTEQPITNADTERNHNTTRKFPESDKNDTGVTLEVSPNATKTREKHKKKKKKKMKTLFQKVTPSRKNKIPDPRNDADNVLTSGGNSTERIPTLDSDNQQLRDEISKSQTNGRENEHTDDFDSKHRRNEAENALTSGDNSMERMCIVETEYKTLSTDTENAPTSVDGDSHTELISLSQSDNQKSREEIRKLQTNGREEEHTADLDLKHRRNTAKNGLTPDDNSTGRMRMLETENKTLRDENSKLQTQLRAKEQMDGLDTQHRRSIAYHENQIASLRNENDDLKNRISKMISDLVTDNNPNITDLSDQNRPSKLGERFGELYNNEWTEACDGLNSMRISDKEAIDMLLNIIVKIDEECRRRVKDEMDTLETAILQVARCSKMTDDLKLSLKQYKDYRKKNYKSAIAVTNEFVQSLLPSGIQVTDFVDQYIRLGYELCWLMCIQDPPLYLIYDVDENDPFDKVHFKEYTVSGSICDYVVWPAICLYENGPVIQKGVMQGKSGRTL